MGGDFDFANDERPTTNDDFPHLTQSNLLKSIRALAPELGSKLSLASIRTQDSPRCVAAANVASSTLVFPDEGGPHISVKHPRGMPPVKASSSGIPLEIISGLGRTSSCDAGRTPVRRSDWEMCLRAASLRETPTSRKSGDKWGTCFPSVIAAKYDEGPVVVASVDMETSRQRKIGAGLPECESSRFAFYSPIRILLPRRKVVKKVREAVC